MGRCGAGFTIIELLFVIAIMLVILMNAPWAGIGQAKERTLIDGVMNDVMTSIALARRAAIFENTMVTYCRSSDGRHCQGAWHEGSIIFTDRNADRVMNADDRLLFRLDPIKAKGVLTFNSFRNRQYLQFTWCPENGDARLARQVIVSLTARTRRARDKDGDGVVEDSRGHPLACD